MAGNSSIWAIIPVVLVAGVCANKINAAACDDEISLM